MKNSTLVSLIVFFTLITNCCNNDDDNRQDDQATLDSSWSLVNVSGGLAGVNDDFEIGLITWGFNPDNSELTITNTNTTNVIYDGFPSGTYDYEVISLTGGETLLTINTFNYVITTLSSSQLIIDEGVAADGFLLTFSK